jgi:transposase
MVDVRTRGGITVTAEQRVAVEARLRRTDLPRRERERLAMVKAVALGYDEPAIARWSGGTVRTVRRWLGQFAAAGLEALQDASRSGRPVKADATYRAALEQAVTTVPRTLGLPFEVWTTGVHVAPGWVRALLSRPDFVCGRPKHTLDHLQDPAAVARFVAEATAAGEKSHGGAGAV